MKVILSRKGFDSSTGGHPSPILPDGTLLSLPIPAEGGNLELKIRYRDLMVSNDLTYYEVMRQLFSKIKINGKKPLIEESECHLDPDLIRNIYKRSNGWKPIFGQVGSSQKHLQNEEVKKGDLFIYFGLFRKVIENTNGYAYDRNSPPIHVIYGYLQIGDIHCICLKTKIPDWMEYHPHISTSLKHKPYNTIYEATDCLSNNSNLPGAGVFKFHPNLQLTKEGLSASKWRLPDLLRETHITYHSKNSWKGDYFQSAMRGQEFVIQENEQVEQWAMNLIEENSKINSLNDRN